MEIIILCALLMLTGWNYWNVYMIEKLLKRVSDLERRARRLERAWDAETNDGK